ncbi:MAG: hypothetical protein PVF27_05955 [Gemmatimonadales bacterium]|jgi:hypothetical protein
MMARVMAVGLLVAVPGILPSQEPGLGRQLRQRGLPAELIAQVEAIAADATAQGLPTAPLADKAVEGWAKHVPPPRIEMAVQQLVTQMTQARESLRSAGIEVPPGLVVAAAAEAMGRGITAEQIGSVLGATEDAELAGHGLRVASALVAQGIPGREAIDVVVGTVRGGGHVSDLLDLPSTAQAMRAQGMTAAQVGQRMLEGAAPGRGVGNRPGSIPPGMGPPESPPGRGRQRRP